MTAEERRLHAFILTIAGKLADASEVLSNLAGKRKGKMMSQNPLNSQVGGSHYKDMPIQPVEFIHKNGIGFIEGCAIKYLCRWRKKGGIEDLKKARHFIELLIALEGMK